MCQNRHANTVQFNLNGRYAKHFTPTYTFNAIGDPIAVAKFGPLRDGMPYKLNESEPPVPERLKRNRMEEFRQWWSVPSHKVLLLLILLFIVAVILIFVIVVTRDANQDGEHFSWLPPIAFRKEQSVPTTMKMVRKEEQVKFEIQGNLPIKNDFIVVMDFRTRKMAIIDSSLKSNGKNLVCFVTNLNDTSLPHKYALDLGARNAQEKKEQTQGWEEAWNYVPAPFSGNATKLFEPIIPECDEARWIYFNYTIHDQKNEKCSDCYDFCLPELGLERDRLRAETFLNIVRRDCFFLFVPEWRSFAQAYSNEKNQQDFEKYYRSSSANAQASGTLDLATTKEPFQNFESKWISLQQIPQQVTNFTADSASKLGAYASNIQKSMSNVAQGITRDLFGNSNGDNNKALINGVQNGGASMNPSNTPTVFENQENFNNGHMMQLSRSNGQPLMTKDNDHQLTTITNGQFGRFDNTYRPINFYDQQSAQRAMDSQTMNG